jgi:8-oxo-dGTP pyrophosphatase MutT (NUDIX family)
MRTKSTVIHRIAVTYVSVYDSNANDIRFLLLLHAKEKKWMPPGGKVADHEMSYEAAEREFLEETGYPIVLDWPYAAPPGVGPCTPTSHFVPTPWRTTYERCGGGEWEASIYHKPLHDQFGPTIRRGESLGYRWMTVEDLEACDPSTVLGTVVQNMKWLREAMIPGWEPPMVWG